jgi:hypothetical protein
LNFHICAFCGHVFNLDFDDTQVPYTEDSCHMFNSGRLWVDHIADVAKWVSDESASWGGKTAIDIGCGAGDFFVAMLKHLPNETFLGFEPGIDADRIDAFPVERDYFEPERDLKLHNPGLLCLRHVMEHLKNPREFLSEISYWSAVHKVYPLLYVEVPCFEKALHTHRVGDLIYEHVSHFTRSSFRALLNLSGFKAFDIRVLHDDEVICGLAIPSCDQVRLHNAAATKFQEGVKATENNVRQTLDEVVASGRSIALWGGTGKSAGFINANNLDAKRFPIVVDSDESKCGKFVPGTGQEITHSTTLLQNPVDIIMITTRWRAADIYREIVRRQIPYTRVLYLNGNQISDYKE